MFHQTLLSSQFLHFFIVDLSRVLTPNETVIERLQRIPVRTLQSHSNTHMHYCHIVVDVFSPRKVSDKRNLSELNRSRQNGTKSNSTPTPKQIPKFQSNSTPTPDQIIVNSGVNSNSGSELPISAMILLALSNQLPVVLVVVHG